MGEIYTSIHLRLVFQMSVPVGVDLADAERIDLVIEKPSGERLVVVAELDDAETGLCHYTTQPSDIDEAGLYSGQPIAVFDDDDDIPGAIRTFRIARRL